MILLDDASIPIAPLRLQTMSLRGIGSYLDGAQIEFAPLTILCGENGSGKSTWLRVLDVLANSMDDPEFPLEVREGLLSFLWVVLGSRGRFAARAG